MPDQKEALGLELRQIIQADRMAADTIQNANYMRRSIEAKTEKDKARILEEAQQRQIELTQKVQAEQASDLDTKKEAALAKNQQKQQTLQQLMDENREQWAADMVQRITTV